MISIMGAAGLKERVYTEFARIGHALASDKRLLLLDLLAQGPRHGEALVAATGMPVASVSQHLQVLRRARLVETERQGTKVFYRLADDAVLDLWLALASVAESRLAEVEQITREFAVEGAEGAEVPRADLEQLVAQGAALLIDVRAPTEYEHGHVRNAVSLPLEELPGRLEELPRDRRIVAYCRGAYCLQAAEAVALLRGHGFDAHRLEGGWPEWRAEGRPTAAQS